MRCVSLILWPEPTPDTCPTEKPRCCLSLLKYKRNSFIRVFKCHMSVFHMQRTAYETLKSRILTCDSVLYHKCITKQTVWNWVSSVELNERSDRGRSPQRSSTYVWDSGTHPRWRPRRTSAPIGSVSRRRRVCGRRRCLQLAQNANGEHPRRNEPK